MMTKTMTKIMKMYKNEKTNLTKPGITSVPMLHLGCVMAQNGLESLAHTLMMRTTNDKDDNNDKNDDENDNKMTKM